MVQTYKTTGNAEIDLDDDGNAVMGAADRGIDTALTRYSGTADPSTVAWGAADSGKVWIDETDAENPVKKEWQDLGGGTYGWRTVRRQKVLRAVVAHAVTFTTTSPAAANVVWEDVNLATLLQDIQDASQKDALVAAVRLRVRIKTGASETLGQDNAYISFRKKGTTAPEHRVYAAVVDRYLEAEIVVPLNTSEVMEFSVTVGGGTASFSYEAWVIEAYEEM